jgi:hypothetical protein
VTEIDSSGVEDAQRSSPSEEAECLARLGKPGWPEKTDDDVSGVKHYQESDQKPVREKNVLLVPFPPVNETEAGSSAGSPNKRDRKATASSSFVPVVPELTIVRYSPEGTLTDLVDRITIVFSKPMMALGRADDQRVGATVTPVVDGGAWSWDDISTLVYRRADGRRLPNATKFTVKIPAQTKSFGVVPVEAVLPRDFEFSFSTPTPQITAAHPTHTKTSWGHVYEKTVGVDPVFQGLFIALCFRVSVDVC